MSDAVEMLAGLRDSLSAFAPTGIVMDPDGLELMICTLDLVMEQIEYERRPRPAQDVRVKPSSLGDIAHRVAVEQKGPAQVLTFQRRRRALTPIEGDRA